MFAAPKLSIWGIGIYPVLPDRYDTGDIAQAAEGFDVNQLRTTPTTRAGAAYPLCGRSHAVTSAQQGDPWAATILQLEQITEHAEADDAPDQPNESGGEAQADKHARATTSLASGYGRNAVVTFVERIGEKAVSISWRDSTGGNYGEQRWVLRAARSRGICALTGKAISRGDSIYHPVSGTRGRPSNLAQMIRAEALERFE